MILRRLNCATPLARIRHDVDDVLGSFFSPFVFDGSSGDLERSGYPAINIQETKDAIVVEAELPGVSPEDIDLTVCDQTLTISGEKKESKVDTGEDYCHVERRFGSFRRDVPLPASVDTNKITASHDQGVLSVRLPKQESAVPKRIEVKGGK